MEDLNLWIKTLYGLENGNTAFWGLGKWNKQLNRISFLKIEDLVNHPVTYDESFLDTLQAIIDRYGMRYTIYVSNALFEPDCNVKFEKYSIAGNVVWCDDLPQTAIELCTLALETSPNKYQGIFQFNRALTIDERRAIGKQVYERYKAQGTDPCIDVGHYCRVPGSMSVKPESKGFKARLVAHNPNLVYEPGSFFRSDELAHSHELAALGDDQGDPHEHTHTNTRENKNKSTQARTKSLDANSNGYALIPDEYIDRERVKAHCRDGLLVQSRVITALDAGILEKYLGQAEDESKGRKESTNNHRKGYSMYRWRLAQHLMYREFPNDEIVAIVYACELERWKALHDNLEHLYEDCVRIVFKLEQDDYREKHGKVAKPTNYRAGSGSVSFRQKPVQGFNPAHRPKTMSEDEYIAWRLDGREDWTVPMIMKTLCVSESTVKRLNRAYKAHMQEHTKEQIVLSIEQSFTQVEAIEQGVKTPIRGVKTPLLEVLLTPQNDALESAKPSIDNVYIYHTPSTGPGEVENGQAQKLDSSESQETRMPIERGGSVSYNTQVDEHTALVERNETEMREQVIQEQEIHEQVMQEQATHEQDIHEQEQDHPQGNLNGFAKKRTHEEFIDLFNHVFEINYHLGARIVMEQLIARVGYYGPFARRDILRSAEHYVTNKELLERSKKLLELPVYLRKQAEQDAINAGTIKPIQSRSVLAA